MERFQLSNGLVVLAEELHHAPVAAFSLWYRVGSRHETPGVTGISHWVEHMMYKGAARFGPGALDSEISRRGGAYNAFTAEDFTAYYEVVPVQHLELTMQIEADRMTGAVFADADVESERTVIIAEREGEENQPLFWLNEACDDACWTVHPYRQGIIGAKSDLESMTRQDLVAHYQTYYAPDNAVVVAAGDFATEQLLRQVERHFGSIPRSGARPLQTPIEPAQAGPHRVTVSRPGPASYFNALYHVPAAGQPEIPALICAAAVLGGGRSPLSWHGRPMGRSSWLYRELVQSGLAVRTSAEVSLRADPSVLSISATASPGIAASKLEAAVNRQLHRLASGEMTHSELAAAKNQVLAQIAYSRAGMLGRAEWLGLFSMLEAEEVGDALPGLIGTVEIADVAAAAGRHLGETNATIGWFVPSDGGRGAGEEVPAGV